MSQENVEIVERLFQRWNQGDYSAIDWADPAIEFQAGTPDSTPAHGIEEMVAKWREFLKTWGDFRGEPKEIIGLGEQVLVLNEFGGHGRRSQIPVAGMRGAALFTFRDGRAIRLTLFSGWDEARKAAGLSE